MFRFNRFVIFQVRSVIMNLFFVCGTAADSITGDDLFAVSAFIGVTSCEGLCMICNLSLVGCLNLVIAGPTTNDNTRPRGDKNEYVGPICSNCCDRILQTALITVTETD